MRRDFGLRREHSRPFSGRDDMADAIDSSSYEYRHFRAGDRRRLTAYDSRAAGAMPAASLHLFTIASSYMMRARIFIRHDAAISSFALFLVAKSLMGNHARRPCSHRRPPWPAR